MEPKRFKKKIIARDKLPMNFPHWVFFYLYMVQDTFGFHWQFWTVAVFTLIVCLIYLARKSVEYTTDDKGRLLDKD